MSHGPQKSGDLAAMMRAVIHDVQHDLPERIHIGISLRIFIRKLSINGVLRQGRSPLFPSLVQWRPLVLQHRQMHVALRIEEAGRRISVYPAEPCAIGGKDMYQGAEDALKGAAKVFGKLCGAEPVGGFD